MDSAENTTATDSKQLSDVLITFKSASNIPVGDIITQSSDSYLVALLTPRTPSSPEYPPFPLTFRTTTKRGTRNPIWEETWHLGGIPVEGFDLKIKIYSEGITGDFNDRLGIADFSVSELPSAGRYGKPGEPQEYVLKIKKRKASRRVTISVQNLGKSICTRNCPCVLGPMRWTTHVSPLIGRLVGLQAHPANSSPSEKVRAQIEKAKQKVITKSNRKSRRRGNPPSPSSYNFEANRLQLLGPIPKDLQCKHVEYRPLLTWIFSGNGIRGFIFQRAMHAEHNRIYCYNSSTKYGVVSTPPEMEAMGSKSGLPEGKEDRFAASRQFLEMVHYDEKPGPVLLGGRLYAYVITLQGEWRFTETGPEFKMQFLSKHSMHSNISDEVAWAGEFFIRRRRKGGGMRLLDGDRSKPLVNGKPDSENHHEKNEGMEAPGFGSRTRDIDDEESDYRENQGLVKSTQKPPDKLGQQDSVDISHKPSHMVGRSHDPRDFVLIIDNDSGTYRPKASVLPSLQSYLEHNLPGLRVRVMAYDDERLKKWKEEQKPKKGTVKVKKIARRGNNESSSDEDNIDLGHS